MEVLRAAFAERYGSPEGAYLVQAPGRVNLMGDHIDYNGLSVLPMALQRRVSVLYRERDDASVCIASTAEGCTARDFKLMRKIKPYQTGDWGNYAKAAAQGLVERFEIHRGFDAVVHSDIPVAAGLSSSSALVVAFALAVLHANDHDEVERLELAELLAEAEHYVGTRGGGMDQAICLAARRQSASRIDFNPLRLTAHPIAPEWNFIIAFSLVQAQKSGAARKTYNTRTRECRDALTRVTEALGIAEKVDSYPALMRGRRVRDLLKAAESALDELPMRRFRHVVTEAERVRKAEEALAAYDLRGFGRLMKASHASLLDDFEVSSPELDELVEIATRAGAAGARLTGAGLGGCVVALCPQHRVDKVMKRLKSRFYDTREYAGPLEDQLFVATPSGGAEVHPV
ncbi:MAG: galactokinase [Gemmatimonadetes bacterium]|nr:galactokinase [Gemmatimonadota bacterium]NIO31431.1 galactokinase [Gemmatimonadota bacterium]